MNKVIIAIGTNVGNRKQNIKRALELLSKKIEILRMSSFYRTKPREGVSGGWFLNGVISARTSMSPVILLRFLQSIENEMGRPVNHEKNTERIIDLDILFYDNRVIRKPNLLIPHPKLTERKFVLKGLNQIEPEFVHPEKATKISQLWKELNK